MNLRFTRRAVRELESIADYIHARNPAASRRVMRALQSAFELIATHPQVGRAQERGLHRLALPRFPYLIFYRVDDLAEVVAVITIRHGARKPFELEN